MAVGDRVEQGVGIIVAVTVAALMAAFLFPVAIDELAATNTGSWSTGASSIFGILDLIFVLVLFLTIIGWAVTQASD